MSISLTGINVLLLIGLLMICIIVFILTFRKIIQLNKIKAVLDRDSKSVSNRNKYDRVNVFKNFGFNLRVGFLSSLAFVLLSFSWTQYEDIEYYPEISFENIDMELIPRTKHEPPLPPPSPPPPVIEEVLNEEIIEEEIEDFVDQSVEEDVIVKQEIPEQPAASVPLPPPPPEITEEIDEIVLIPESMPRFPGCEKMDGTNNEKKACSDKKMLAYIYQNLKYPQIALSNGIEGTVVIQFVVDKEGKVSDVKLVRKVGAGCDEAAVKVIRDMNKLPERWTPGKQRGRNVKVLYTLPVKFKLLK